MRAPQIHRQPGNQVVFVNRDSDCIRDDHHKQQRSDAGEDEAVDRDDDRGALQVFQLGMSKFTVDLRQRFLAAHGQYGVAERDQNSENAKLLCQVLSQSWSHAEIPAIRG